MCPHGYFYRGNEKQTRTTKKNINFVPLRMSHSLKLPYRSRISYRILNLVFYRGRGGDAYLKRGGYSKFEALVGALGANSSIYCIARILLH